MHLNIIQLAGLICTLAKDVKFGERPDDRIRNKHLPDEGTEEPEFTDEFFYIPNKWPYSKNKRDIAHNKKVDKKIDKKIDKEEEEEEKSDEAADNAASNPNAPRWKHDVNIHYDTVGFSKKQQEFMRRIGNAIWDKTCVHFLESDIEKVSPRLQFLRFKMEEPGCDEIIGMKDISYERPQIQGMNKDCVMEMTPQFTSHYLMHIMGFDNEHQRPDNKEHIQVKSKDSIALLDVPQRFGRKGHNFTVAEDDSVSYANGPFDPKSLMMWDPAYVGQITVDGKEVETSHMASDIGRVFGQLEGELKNGDIDKVNRYYECERLPDLPKTTTTTKQPAHSVKKTTTTTSTTTAKKTTKAPKKTTKGPKKTTTTTTTTTTKKKEKAISCVYHIREDGNKDVAKKCFDNFAKVNVWPQEEKIVHIEVLYNIEEGGDAMEQMNGRRLDYANELKSFETNHTKNIFNENIDHNCDRANISNSTPSDINTAHTVVCGRGVATFKSECGRGMKHDYKKTIKGWNSKSFNAYFQVNALYEPCPKRVRGIALETEGGILVGDSYSFSYIIAFITIFA